MSALTEYRVGDTVYDLVAKILRKLGGQPRLGDTEEDLWRKIVVQFGGTSTPSDSRFDSLLKIERILDPQLLCRCGDTEVDLLKAILFFLGGSPRPGDTEFDLLRKILDGLSGSEGENCLLLADGSEFFLAERDACLLLAAP